MSTKQNAKVAAAIVAAMSQVQDEPVAVSNGKMDMVDADGAMLTCNLNLAKRAGAPDPLCVTINEEFRWIKRGANVIVPWYLVVHLKNNIERKFRQEKDEQGKNIIVHDDMPSEAFNYSLINPPAGVTDVPGGNAAVA